MEPFIHRFKTEKNNYIYDVNTNKIFVVGEATYQIINENDLDDPEKIKSRYPRFTMKEIVESLWEISEAQKRGLFSSHKPCKMAFDNELSIEVLSSTARHEQLILNVTEKCNLRCKYCVYSGKYKGWRTHSEREMSSEIAKKAVDKFLDRSADKFFVSFYGGEPLLNFRLIESIICYITERTTKEIDWSMTTNGTLLTNQRCDYLAEKAFLLNISLDGPKHIHDRYRVYKDGTGTFDSVIRNLEYIKANYPEYYKKKVMFSVVNTPPFYLKEVVAFFQENPLLKNNLISFNNMNYDIEDFCYSVTSEDLCAYDKERQDLSNDFFYQVASGNEQRSNLLKSMFYKDFILFYHRPKTDLLEMLNPNGCCIPGARRIFVSTDGTLHVCEKMDNSYPIGDVENWIDARLVRKLYREYIDLSQDCFNCWACRLCTRCFSNFVRNSILDKETRTLECRSTRAHWDNVLMGYYGIHEQDALSLDFLRDMELE